MIGMVLFNRLRAIKKKLSERDELIILLFYATFQLVRMCNVCVCVQVHPFIHVYSSLFGSKHIKSPSQKTTWYFIWCHQMYSNRIQKNTNTSLYIYCKPWATINV